MRRLSLDFLLMLRACVDAEVCRITGRPLRLYASDSSLDSPFILRLDCAQAEGHVHRRADHRSPR